MKAIKISVLVLMVLAFPLVGSAQGISFFKGSFAEAQAKAQKEHKYLVMDCYTDWCGWCKFMDMNLYPKKEVGDFYNADFVFLKMDMEKGEGVGLAKKYHVQVYPTFLFFDSQGELAHCMIGADTTVNGFIDAGKKAMDPMHSLRGLKQRLAKGEKDTAFLKELIAAANNYADPEACEKALALYWPSVSHEQLLEPQYWQMFKYYEGDINSPVYDYVYSHLPRFTAVYHQSEDSNIVYMKAVSALKTAWETNKDETLCAKARKIAKQSTNLETRDMLLVYEMPWMSQKGDTTDYFADLDQFQKQYGYRYLSGLIYSLSKDVDNKYFLEKGLVYADTAMKIAKNYFITESYATMLYKLGRYAEALASANEALDMAVATQNEYLKNKTTTEAKALVDEIQKHGTGQ